jgi:selenocysteine-specific translation elongation factor
MSFQFTVRNVFTLTGRGTVVLGRIDAGLVNVGDSLQVERTGQSVLVKSIESVRDKHSGTPQPSVGLMIGDVPVSALVAGDVLRS